MWSPSSTRPTENASAADDMPRPRQQGLLLKCNERGAWQQRWFVLEQAGLLRYYDAQTAAGTSSRAARGAVALSMVDKVELKPADTVNHTHPFDVSAGPRTYRLAAYTAEEASKWCSVLQEAEPSGSRLTAAHEPDETPGLSLSALPTVTPLAADTDAANGLSRRQSEERTPCFCFGSNSVAQLKERCKNDKLVAEAATLPGYRRIFAGKSAKWGGGGVRRFKARASSPSRRGAPPRRRAAVQRPAADA